MNIKNENGITLVALIVTIVVMAVLATIAISASVGDSGVVNQTKAGIINASIREVEEALETKLLLKEKEEIKKGNLSNLNISVLQGLVDTPDDTSDDILVYKGEETIDAQKYNVYTINISKLDIKGKYGKGTTADVFRVKVKVEGENETNDYVVEYIP